MSFAAHGSQFTDGTSEVAPSLPRHASDGRAEAARPAQPAFWRRLMARMIAARQERANREIAAYLDRSGGRLSDSVEREMMSHLMHSGRILRG